MAKLIRVATVPISLNILLKGQLKFLSQHYNLTAVSSAGEDLERVMEREGVKVKAINIERQISPFKDLRSLISLYFFFRNEKPDIVHSITPKAGLLSMIAAKYAGVPVRMHTFTGLIFPYRHGVFQKLLIAMDRLLCLHATHIYPEGVGVKKDLINFGITKKPLKIIANGNVNGLDLHYFSPNSISEETQISLKKKLNISETDFVFVFVGRLVKDKGINELVSAFQNLNSKIAQPSNSQTLQLSNPPTLKLLLVGPFEHELDALLPETILEIEKNPNIISVGFQKDVRPYFSVSDALVFPSYREGFPNVVLQAGAMELPSIVSDINGCNEIIENGINGIIVPPKNVDALEEAMQKLLQNELLREKLSKNARPLISDRYSQEYVWKALLDEYRRVAE